MQHGGAGTYEPHLWRGSSGLMSSGVNCRPYAQFIAGPPGAAPGSLKSTLASRSARDQASFGLALVIDMPGGRM